MLTREQKCMLYRLLYKANQHDIKQDDLFLFLSKEGPAQFKEVCSKVAIDIKKNQPLHEAGKRNGVFNHFESKVVQKAAENGKLGTTLGLLIDHHELRNTHHQSHFNFIAPLAFLTLTAIVIHGMPELFLKNQPVSSYAVKTLGLCLLFIGFMWVIGRPKALLSNKFVKSLGIPKLLMSLPSSKNAHAERQITSFTESAGICKLSGYEWEEAFEVCQSQVTNPLISKDISHIPTRMKRQDTFEDALKACEYFPERYIKELETAMAEKRVPETLIHFKEKQIINSEHRIKKSLRTPSAILLVATAGLLTHAAMKAELIPSLPFL